jgi:hypothetical protein
MLGIYDFNDALTGLFKLKNCYRAKPLSEFANSVCGMDILQLVNLFLLSDDRINFRENLRKISEGLGQHNIKFFVMMSGIKIINLEQLSYPCNIVKSMREKFYYFFLLILFHRKSIGTDKDDLLNTRSRKYLNHRDSFITFYYYITLQREIHKAITTEKIEVFRAPQFAESQLLYQLSSKRINVANTFPLLYLLDENQPLITEFDIENQQAWICDFEALAASYSCSKARLKKGLVGCFVYFMCKKNFRKETKFSKAALTKIDDFESTLELLTSENIKFFDGLLTDLILTLENDDTDAMFCLRIAEKYRFDAQMVFDCLSYLYNSVVSKEGGRLGKFPGDKVFRSSALLVNTRLPELVYLYHRNYFDEELFSLCNDCRLNKCYIFFPKFQSQEFDYAFSVYFKNKLEIALSKVLFYLPQIQDRQFKLNLFAQTELLLAIKPFELPLKGPLVEGGFQFSLYNTLYSFYESSLDKRAWIKLTDLNSITYKQALNYIYCAVLQDIGYLNLHEKKLFLLGAGILDAGHHQFHEELIIIFEIIKNNLLRADIIVEQKSILRGHHKFFKDPVFEGLMTNFEEIMRFLRDVNLEISETTNYMNLMIESVRITPNDLRELKSPNDTSAGITLHALRSSLAKTLNTYFITIRSFARNYQEFCQKKQLADRSEMVFKCAFHNDYLQKVQFISRLFIFSKVDFMIENLFDMDIYHFEQIIVGVVKGLSALVSANFVSFLFGSKNFHNASLIDQIAQRFLFKKNYAPLAGILMKVLLIQFALHESLVKLHDPYAAEYKWLISIESLKAQFPINFDLVDFLTNGKLLIQKVYLVVESVNTHYQSEMLAKISEIKADVLALLDRVIKFYGQSDLS